MKNLFFNPLSDTRYALAASAVSRTGRFALLALILAHFTPSASAQSYESLTDMVTEAFDVSADRMSCTSGSATAKRGTFFGIREDNPSFTPGQRRLINDAVSAGLNNSPKRVNFGGSTNAANLAPILLGDNAPDKISELLRNQSDADYIVVLTADRPAQNIASIDLVVFEKHENGLYDCNDSKTFFIYVDSQLDATEEASSLTLDQTHFIETKGYSKGLDRIRQEFIESDTNPKSISVHHSAPGCDLGRSMIGALRKEWTKVRSGLPTLNVVSKPDTATPTNIILIDFTLDPQAESVVKMSTEYHGGNGLAAQDEVLIIFDTSRVQKCREQLEETRTRMREMRVEALVEERHKELLERLAAAESGQSDLLKQTELLIERIKVVEDEKLLTEKNLSETRFELEKAKTDKAQLEQEMLTEENARRSAELRSQNLIDAAQKTVRDYIEFNRLAGQTDISDHVLAAQNEALRDKNLIPEKRMEIFLQYLLAGVELEKLAEPPKPDEPKADPAGEVSISKNFGTGSCQEQVSAKIIGPVARISLQGGCRESEQLKFLYKPKIALRNDTHVTDRHGEAYELVLPVVREGQAVLIEPRPGERPDSFDLETETDGQIYVVLEWQEAVDLDLHVFEGRATRGSDGHVTAERQGLGRIVLDQNQSARQNPRFAIYQIDEQLATDRRIEILYIPNSGRCHDSTVFDVHVFQDGERRKTSSITGADCSGEPVPVPLR